MLTNYKYIQSLNMCVSSEVRLNHSASLLLWEFRDYFNDYVDILGFK